MKLRSKSESPFKHYIFDEPIHPRTAQEIFSELSTYTECTGFYHYDNYFEKKHATDKWGMFPPTTRAWLNWTLSGDFVKWAEEVSGIKGLIPDPHLRGGGIHLHKSGGILRPHTDFNIHPDLGLVRRLNYIIYFNKNYEESWGGQLEFWTRRMDGRLADCIKIQPAFNVGVLFETPEAAHGFSVPWDAPNDITRKSLAVYLYSAPTREDLEQQHKSTCFLPIPGEETSPEIEELRERRNNGRLQTNI